MTGVQRDAFWLWTLRYLPMYILLEIKMYPDLGKYLILCVTYRKVPV